MSARSSTGYRLRLTLGAERILRKLAVRDKALYRNFRETFEEIRRNPTQGKALKGRLAGRHSWRLGVYRVIYRIHRRELLILILDLAHRRDVYRLG